MRLEDILFLILLVPSEQINRIYTNPIVPWLVEFSMLPLLAWSRPTGVTGLISVIVMLVFFNAQNAAQMIYSCYLDPPDNYLEVTYSRRKCMNKKLAVVATVVISLGILVKRAWR